MIEGPGYHLCLTEKRKKNQSSGKEEKFAMNPQEIHKEYGFNKDKLRNGFVPENTRMGDDIIGKHQVGLAQCLR